MDRFNGLLKLKDALDAHLANLLVALREERFACKSTEDLIRICKQQVKELSRWMDLYEKYYKLLGEATILEYDRPWWKFW